MWRVSSWLHTRLGGDEPSRLSLREQCSSLQLSVVHRGVCPESWLLHRLEELQSFLLYKNKLTYLPQAMLNLRKLTLLVVSGDHLVELPTALCDASTPLK